MKDLVLGLLLLFGALFPGQCRAGKFESNSSCVFDKTAKKVFHDGKRKLQMRTMICPYKILGNTMDISTVVVCPDEIKDADKCAKEKIPGELKVPTKKVEESGDQESKGEGGVLQ